ncbi:MAG: hypothetical protein ACLT5Z_04205 [Eisenbergiella sp.]
MRQAVITVMDVRYLVGCNAISGVIGKHISRRILGGPGVCCNGW